MLFSIATLALSLLLPLAVVLAYRQGVRDGRAIKENRELQPIRHTFKQHKVHTEDKRINQILRNIDSYDGTGEGQIDV